MKTPRRQLNENDVERAPRTRQMLLSVTLESAQVIRFELVGDGHVERASRPTPFYPGSIPIFRSGNPAFSRC